MTTAALFPGQGTEIAGVLREWRDQSPCVAALLALAADASGTPREAFAAPTSPRTATTQPLLTALTTGISAELAARGVRADVVVGHSVGELAACAAAGALSSADAVVVAATRGRLMEREAALQPGAMLAVRASEGALRRLLDECAGAGAATIAAHNGPDEWVVSGALPALRAIAARVHATPLVTGGPWHSAVMRGAAGEYEETLRLVVRGPLRVSVVSNHTASFVEHAERLPALLAAQLTSPVRWWACMERLRDAGVTRAIVCGPGKALARYARAAMPALDVRVVARPGDLAAACAP